MVYIKVFLRNLLYDVWPEKILKIRDNGEVVIEPSAFSDILPPMKGQVSIMMLGYDDFFPLYRILI